MKYYTLYEVVFPVCYLTVGLFLVWTAANGLLRKKAVVYPGHRGYAALVLFLIPLFITCINLVFIGPRGSAPDLNDFGLIAIPLSLIFMWSRFKGAHVIGVTRQSLSDALRRVDSEQTLKVRSVFGLGLGSWQVHLQDDAPLAKEQTAALREIAADYYLAYVVNLSLGVALITAGLLVRIFS